MTLGFSTEINGKACHFPKKIAASFGEENGFNAKSHSIRKGYRWKIGMKIHMVTGNRTKERTQFRETICKGWQGIEAYWKGGEFCVIIDRYRLRPEQIEILAVNDGFENAQELEAFFASVIRAYETFNGQIIHWSEGRYVDGNWVCETANPVNCIHLLSPEFSEKIENMFTIETRKKHVENITRAYYVFIDLKNGFSIDKIEKSRLECFHSFLWGYLLVHKNDNLSHELWKLCDNVLSLNLKRLINASTK